MSGNESVGEDQLTQPLPDGAARCASARQENLGLHMLLSLSFTATPIVSGRLDQLLIHVDKVTASA